MFKLLKKSFSFFSSRDRYIIFGIGAFQIILNLMDLIGVALIGAIGSVGVAGLQGQKTGNRVSRILELIGINQQIGRAHV